MHLGGWRLCIRRIQINKWRHFQNIDLQLDEDAALVCIVGANGTGKSHLLELIAACAHRLGPAPGIELSRGDPFSDPHDFTLQFYLAQGVSDAIDQGLAGSPDLLNGIARSASKAESCRTFFKAQ